MAKDGWPATCTGYAAYFDRWAETWERQALVRARVVAGDRALGERFMALVDEFVWDRPLTDDDVAAIRRMKARIERERIPSREDPQFHLKLGRGSLSDIEWTVQLLQLRHHVPGAEHPRPRSRPWATGACSPPPTWRRCATPTGSANGPGTAGTWWARWPGAASPGDALPTQADQLSHLARSLGTTPRRCATTTAGSPGGPAGWSSASSTGSRTRDGRRRPVAPTLGGTRPISIRAVRSRERC